MPEYRVIYEIDVVADSPQEAATEALECIIHSVDPPIFQVVPWDGENPPKVVDEKMGVLIDTGEMMNKLDGMVSRGNPGEDGITLRNGKQIWTGLWQNPSGIFCLYQNELVEVVFYQGRWIEK